MCLPAYLVLLLLTPTSNTPEDSAWPRVPWGWGCRKHRPGLGLNCTKPGPLCAAVTEPLGERTRKESRAPGAVETAGLRDGEGRAGVHWRPRMAGGSHTEEMEATQVSRLEWGTRSVREHRDATLAMPTTAGTAVTTHGEPPSGPCRSTGKTLPPPLSLSCPSAQLGSREGQKCLGRRTQPCGRPDPQTPTEAVPQRPGPPWVLQTPAPGEVAAAWPARADLRPPLLGRGWQTGTLTAWRRRHPSPRQSVAILRTVRATENTGFAQQCGH